MRRVLVLLLAISVWACGDTFMNVKTGEKLEGKLLGTIIEGGKRLYLVKVGRDHRRLIEDDWHVKMAPPAGEEFSWKPTIYQKEVRDAAWLKRTYRSVCRDFTMARDVPIDLRLPVLENEMAKDGRIRLSGLVKSTGPGRRMILLADVVKDGKESAAEIHVVDVDCDGLLVGKRWSELVGFIHIHTPWDNTPTTCVPLEKSPPPLTPEEFLALLAKDFDFEPKKPKRQPRGYYWDTCDRCKGKKKIRIKARRISGGIYEYYYKVIECPTCRGTGKVMKHEE